MYVCRYVLTRTNQRDRGLAGLGGGEVKKEEAGEKGEGERGMERLTCRERKEKDKGLYRATEWETWSQP